MKKYSITLILAVYLTLSLTTLTIWNKRDVNTATGDEPHYLIIASGIANHGTLEQTLPYKEEFLTKKIYTPGLASTNTEPSPENTHTILGPHGLFNIHNIGLPAILSPAFAIGGVLGSKIFMIILSGLAIMATWKISTQFSTDRKVCFFSTLSTCVAFPLIAASNQIYPDILAGTISLIGVHWFFTTKKQRSLIEIIFLSATIALLPWLQIKFAATSILLSITITTKTLIELKDKKKTLAIALTISLSYLALFAYNDYAFDKISGPYQPGALELSKTSLMVLLGLFIDQNQGILFHNPITLIGLLFTPHFYKHNKRAFILWLLVFLSLIVPNALHPNWYGGGSFSGRFAWAASIALFAPTVFGLIKLEQINKKTFIIAILLSSLLQTYLYYQYTFSNINLLNKPQHTWLSNYSTFYNPIHAWLPALYNVEWAYRHIPNYAWICLIIAILIFGYSISKKQIIKTRKTLIYSIITSSAIAVIASGLFNNNTNETIAYLGKDLPSNTGTIINTTRHATTEKDRPGFVTFGPYIALRNGSYVVTLKYFSSASSNQKIGNLDIFDSTKNTTISEQLLKGTAGENRSLEIEFHSVNTAPHLFEFRNHWDGVSDITIQEIVLRRI